MGVGALVGASVGPDTSDEATGAIDVVGLPEAGELIEAAGAPVVGAPPQAVTPNATIASVMVSLGPCI